MNLNALILDTEAGIEGPLTEAYDDREHEEGVGDRDEGRHKGVNDRLE
jgi:hypothetical protein